MDWIKFDKNELSRSKLISNFVFLFFFNIPVRVPHLSPRLLPLARCPFLEVSLFCSCFHEVKTSGKNSAAIGVSHSPQGRNWGMVSYFHSHMYPETFFSTLKPTSHAQTSSHASSSPFSSGCPTDRRTPIFTYSDSQTGAAPWWHNMVREGPRGPTDSSLAKRQC